MAIDVSKQVQKAEVAAQQKKWEMAIEIFLQALAIDPDNRAARRGVRLAAVKQAELSPVSGLTQKARRVGLEASLRLPKLDQRIEALEGYLRIDPKNVDLSLRLGKTCEEAGYPNGAIGVYEGIAEIHPKEPFSRTNLGRLLGSKEPQKALEHLERALAIDGRNQDAIKLRKDLAAEISIRKTGFESARTTHDLLRDKERAKELMAGDKIQRAETETGDLITRIEARIRQNPTDRKSLRELARALASAGRTEDAKGAWKRLIEVDPTDFDAKVQLGDLRIAQVERALAAAEKRGDAGSVENLRRQRLQVLTEEYQARVAEHPTDLGLRFQLAEVLQSTGRIDEAIGEYQKAVKDPRKRVEALCQLGECFIAKDLHDLAARQLEKAMEESPGLNSEQGKRLVYNLGVLREHQGQFAAARDEYLKVYEVDVSYRDVAAKVTEMSRKAK